MIVFDLKCEGSGHVFEAWFGSSADFEDQKGRGLLACPICGDARVEKALMAPAIPAKCNRKPEPVAGATDSMASVASGEESRMRAMMEALAQAQKTALESSTWVGRAFAEQARAMHYGEQAQGSIHGEVAPAEARALFEEGVAVAPLPFPVVPPQAKN